MATIREIVFDCENAAALARFWAEVVDGYAVRSYDEDDIAELIQDGLTPETDPKVAVDGPGPTLFFQQVPESKATKNRIHLDVEVADVDAEVERLRNLGATVYQEFETWTVMHDPEGNEFCVALGD